MCTRSIAGLTWKVRSPSEFKLAGFNVWLIRDAQGWYLTGTDHIYAEVNSRDEGAALVAQIAGRLT